MQSHTKRTTADGNSIWCILQVAIKRLFCFRATETDYTKHTHMHTCVYVPLACVARQLTARAHAQAIYYSMTQSPYAISSQCAWCYDVYACLFICHTVRVRGHDRNVRETIKSQQHRLCVYAFRWEMYVICCILIWLVLVFKAKRTCVVWTQSDQIAGTPRCLKKAVT